MEYKVIIFKDDNETVDKIVETDDRNEAFNEYRQHKYSEIIETKTGKLLAW